MRYRSNLNRLWVLLGILVVILLGLLTWFNYNFCVQNPGGNDFLVHWMGTRNLLSRGVSPYSDDTALKIQQYAYGRAAKPGEHELRVAYPLYSVVVFTPYALIPNYNFARALWMTTLEIALIAIGFICLKLTKWKPGVWVMGFYFLFILTWYHGARPVINGNAIILVTLFVYGGILALRDKADELAGVLFAFSTIKPHIVLIILIFILLWGTWNKRWRMHLWFSITLSLLVVTSFLLVPDWILQNLREVARYSSYNPPGTLGSALRAMLPGVNERFDWAILLILALVLLVEWGAARRREGFRGFLWTCSLTMVVSQWIGIQTDPGNFIFLFLPLPLVFSIWHERWKRGGQIFSVASMVLLLFSLWAIFIRTIGKGAQPQQSPIMFLPLPLFLLIILYWVKWWAFRPPKAPVEEFIEFDQMETR